MSRRHRLARSRIVACLVPGLAALLGGCSTGYTTLSHEPPARYEVLGPAVGEADGSLGVVIPSWYFVPIAFNSRIDRAYERAVDSVPGATALIDVTYQESWYWWVLATARTVTVSGTAIREIRE